MTPAWILVFVPAVLGLAALLAGSMLIVYRPRDADPGSTMLWWLLPGVCFLIAFGIAVCHGMVWMDMRKV